ncbi:MAG TPA: hypothetical protein VMG60_21505 [Burkholderiaceae bacterium]|nr:hypothetical protein [Burkholderiaceae bacterium]
MRRIAMLGGIVVVGVTGCATGGDPAATAERECGYLARNDGARLVRVDGVEAVSEGDANFKVKMLVEDALERKANAECLYSSASNKARWAAPLPASFRRV